MNQSYCYSFRFCCDPGFNDRREIASLRRFVREAQIDDVAVFCNVEELNTGHMTEEEQETIWLRLLCDVQAALAPEGVQLSVNHWHSLMHADLGKTLPQSQPFRRMVDMDGREADLCVCRCANAGRPILPGFTRATRRFRRTFCGWRTISACITTIRCAGAAASARRICANTPAGPESRS